MHADCCPTRDAADALEAVTDQPSTDATSGDEPVADAPQDQSQR